MTSSSRASSESVDELPRALPSMWRLVRLGYDSEPRLIVTAFVLALLAALPDALMALWLALLARGALDGDGRLVLLAALALGVSAALERHVARLQASVETVAHQERPEYLDRLSVLRDQVFVLDHLFMSLFSTAGWVLRLGATVALLMAVNPALVLLALFALPTVLTSGWRPGVERVARERGAQAERLARHLFAVSTTASTAKELRVLGVGERLAGRRRASWEQAYTLIARARWVSSVWHTLGWTTFGLGYVGAVVFVASGLDAP